MNSASSSPATPVVRTRYGRIVKPPDAPLRVQSRRTIDADYVSEEDPDYYPEEEDSETETESSVDSSSSIESSDSSVSSTMVQK